MTNLLNHVSPDAITLRLLSLPEEIAQAETSAHLLTERHRVAQEMLQRREDALLTDPEGPINGKNEAVRSAQLRTETVQERETLNCALYRLEEARISLKRLQNEFSALKSVARLLSGGTD